MEIAVSPREWHHLPLVEVVRHLDTDPEFGLSNAEAMRRLQHYGPNELRGEEKNIVLRLIIDQFKDAFVIMLIFAALASYIVGEPIDAVLIFILVAFSATLGFVQEYRAEKAVEALKKMAAPTAIVIRDGVERTIPSREVVPGDILILKEGDRVPADARLIESVSLKLDEASLTGESTPVSKRIIVVERETPVADRSNMVFMGTYVVFGHGKGVVTSTGMKTEFGRIAGAVAAVEEEKTPLKLKLKVFTKKLGVVIIGLCISIFVLEVFKQDFVVSFIVDALLTAIALAVSAVPEALPGLVTITLALGARELATLGAIVRKLASAETLGSVTYICADKTGTLTKGEMTVRRLFVNGNFIEVTGSGYDPKGEFLLAGKRIKPKDDEHVERLLSIGALCNNARYDEEKCEIIGDPTEGALLVSAVKAGINLDELKKRYRRIGEIPFSSERKKMTTIHFWAGKMLAFVKGAPEVILELCTWIFESGEFKRITEEERKRLLRVNEEMASEGLRVLGMAYRELPEGMKEFEEETVERELIFVGFQGMMDPPRKEAIRAIALCKRAGIKNIMITGDHKLTAIAVAKELGMLSEGEENRVLTGTELERLSPEEYDKIVDKIVIYARVSPIHKLRIVEALKKKGEIVAMTGDGVNDAPALKRADIGVAMGITGTDVSKEAADMVLSDDNYATLVKAIEKGRAIYDNIRKYLRFLIACNFDELIVVGFWTLLGFPLPLLPTQILFINLVTDGPPALALSVDIPEEDMMERPPRDPKKGIFHGMLHFILASAIAQAIGGSICFAYGLFICGSYAKAVTMTFLQASLFELFVIWNCRSETHSLWRLGRRALHNRFLVLGVLLCLLLTISLPYLPFIRPALRVVPLNLFEWALVFITASWGLIILPEYLMSTQ
jgi:Ca2+-transporting ATPase